MKKAFAALLALTLLLISLTATASYSGLTRDEYEVYYEVSEYLCDDWYTPSEILLDDIAHLYGLSADELYEFMLYAADSDWDHVWIPVNGGTKFHAYPDCSAMIDPRPTTIDVAMDFGFDACKRCNP